MNEDLKPSQIHPKEILREKIFSLEDMNDVKKKIEKGIFWCLKLNLLDNNIAKKVLSKLDSIIKEGIEIEDVLSEIDQIIHDDETMKLVQRQFTASDLFEDPEFLKKLNQGIQK